MAIHEIDCNADGSGRKVGVVVARFNDYLTRQLLGGALDCLKEHKVLESDITVVWVPGANEIPGAVDQLIKAESPDVVIGLGCVIQGETRHADLILDQATQTMSQLALTHDLPVINSIIAAHSVEQAVERCAANQSNKGRAAALAGLEMMNVYSTLRGDDGDS